jgi:hypothetical protein
MLEVLYRLHRLVITHQTNCGIPKVQLDPRIDIFAGSAAGGCKCTILRSACLTIYNTGIAGLAVGFPFDTGQSQLPTNLSRPHDDTSQGPLAEPGVCV